MENFEDALDSKLGLYVKALTFAGTPGAGVFYVLEDSGANEIVTYLITILVMGLIILSIIVKLQIEQMEAVKDDS